MYRFKKEYADAVIVISGLKGEITAKNLTDPIAEMIIVKYPHLAHNIEQVDPNEVSEEDPEAELDRLVALEEKKKGKKKNEVENAE